LVVSVLAYAFLIIVLRIAGKRSLAKLNAFDFVVTVAFGSTLATILLSKQVALAEGVLAFVMLGTLQWIISRLSICSATFSGLVRSQPRLLFEQGRYREEAMKAERVTQAEVDAAIRQAGFPHRAQVAAVVLETDGSLSVLGGTDGGSDLLGDVQR
jgi:uncharacterized membrane protein YcaP (DUF421 family)